MPLGHPDFWRILMNKEYLINEKPLKALFLFSIPMIIGNLFQQFYTMADSIVVGRYVSENALAAVGASYSLTNVFICIAVGGGAGASVLTGHNFGAREYSKMKQSISTTLITFLFLSIILAITGLIFGRNIMSLLNTPDNILDIATDYLNIYFLGLPFLFMYNLLSALFNALGRSKIPLYLLIFSSVFNIVLDVYLVRNLNMGVVGVAWATFIAQGISAIISFIIFLYELKSYKGKADNIFSANDLGSISKVALPSILQQSTVSIGMMLVQSVVNSFGAEMLAGFSAAMRVESICVVPMAALGNAMSSYTAQNIGSGKLHRVKKGYHTVNFLVICFGIIICLNLQLLYTPIINMFLGNEGTQLALQTGTGYLKFMSWFFPLIGFKMAADGLLRGAADMTMFTLANLANLTFRVLFAVIMAPHFGIAMVWYAVPIGWFINFIISYCEYKTENWHIKN